MFALIQNDVAPNATDIRLFEFMIKPSDDIEAVNRKCVAAPLLSRRDYQDFLTDAIAYNPAKADLILASGFLSDFRSQR